MVTEDTIVAIATALQPAGLGVIRISGPESVACARVLFVPSRGSAVVEKFPNHTMIQGWITDGGKPLDEVLLAVMRAPHSYTSEDVVEIHAHGSVLGLQSILRLILAQGIRLAKPGEFTERAFLNGKLDLTQAEAVSDLIHAQSDQSLKLAAEQLKGRLQKEIQECSDELMSIASLVEATIEFPDENQKFTNHDESLDRIKRLHGRMDQMLSSTSQAMKIRDGMRVVLMGRPNVGKSSLLNLFLGKSRAIVTEVAGTTRDTIEESLQINGLAFRLTDTAGIQNSENPVEIEGIRRSRLAWKESDMTMVILDASQKFKDGDGKIMEECNPAKTLIVLNKMDLCQGVSPDWAGSLKNFEVQPVSAKTGIGLEDLKRMMYQKCTSSFVTREEGAWLTNLRQHETAERAWNSLGRACQGLKENQGEELVAVDLRIALNALGEIVGKTTTEDLLERIFSEFCIGK